MLRFYNPRYAGKGIYGEAFSDSIMRRLTANEFYEGAWQVCDQVSMPHMSAVAYYFGRRIVSKTEVPQGLINLAIGGAPIETFISKKALEGDPVFSKKAKGSWLTNNSLPIWVRERGKQNVGESSIFRDDLGPNHAFKPGFAFEGGIAPIIPFQIKGILWYQGESNAQEKERVNEYVRLMKLMVDDYRMGIGSSRCITILLENISANLSCALVPDADNRRKGSTTQTTRAVNLSLSKSGAMIIIRFFQMCIQHHPAIKFLSG